MLASVKTGIVSLNHHLKRVHYFPVSYSKKSGIAEHKYQKHPNRKKVSLISIKQHFAIGSNPLWPTIWTSLETRISSLLED